MQPLFFGLMAVTILLNACSGPAPAPQPSPVPSPTPAFTEPPARAAATKHPQAVYEYLADSVLHGHKALMRHYFHQYTNQPCEYDQPYAQRFSDFEGLMSLGDINHNGIPDSVFVLPPVTDCFAYPDTLDGESYYFTDATLPRFLTDSYCCHPKWLFKLPDFDEDGVNEIGIYYSSCVSHYKALLAYSLKHRQWKEIGGVTYDLHYADTSKPYAAYVRKTAKNHFEMLQITDLPNGDTTPHWIKFKM